MCKGATASETTGCARAQRPARSWWRQLVVEGHNGQKGSGGDSWLWKGTTVGKGSTEEVLYGNGRQGFDGKKSYAATVGKGSTGRSPIRQQSARVRRKKSYTATVGKGSTEEVLYGNSLRLGLVLLRLHSTDRSWLWSDGTGS